MLGRAQHAREYTTKIWKMQQVNIVYLIRGAQKRCMHGEMDAYVCVDMHEYATWVLQIFVLYVVVFDVSRGLCRCAGGAMSERLLERRSAWAVQGLLCRPAGGPGPKVTETGVSVEGAERQTWPCLYAYARKGQGLRAESDGDHRQGACVGQG